jgi:hypothetical protein
MAPNWGVNYNVGYIGFISPVTDSDLVSIGITYCERWDKLSDISVVHAFIVTGENQCIEAIMNPGVVIDPLESYFNDPKRTSFSGNRWTTRPKLGLGLPQLPPPKLGKSTTIS